MEKRNISFDKKKIYDGVRKLSAAVGSTLGPKGRPVLIEDIKGHGRVTKDGVTVARLMELPDPQENLGAKFVTQAASATVQVAGDGTTTSTILAHAIIEGAEEDIDFIKGIEAASKDVIAYLEDETEKTTPDLIKHIAYVSTNNDEGLSEIITEAFVETGEDGIVDVKYSPKAAETSLDMKTGSYLEAGYSHQHFITNMRQRTFEGEDCYVLVSSATLEELGQIEHVLKDPVAYKKPIIIIADAGKNFTEAFTSNVQKGNITGCIVNPNQFVSSDTLRDLAALLGGKYFDNANGNTFDYVGDSFWGKADSVVIGQQFSLFTLENNDHVQERIEDLKSLIKETEQDSLKEEYRKRLGMLNGKYATIVVGAPTQGESLEIKDRIDDAVFAVGAAQKFGYLPGGGVALLQASKYVPKQDGSNSFAGGYNHLLKVIQSPFDKILSNAGIKCDCVFDYGQGIDASTGDRVNMVEAGIIDPSLVTTQALINAVSAATTLLSCEAALLMED